VFSKMQSTEAPEPSMNPQWLQFAELVSHRTPGSSQPCSPRAHRTSEPNEPVAEADQEPTAAELAELVAIDEEEEEYEFRRMHALLQARQEPVTDRPFAVEHSARLHTHRYRLRPSWPRLRSSLTIEQLADACVVLEVFHQNYDDAEWLLQLISGDNSTQFVAIRDAHTRHWTRTYIAQGLAYVW